MTETSPTPTQLRSDLLAASHFDEQGRHQVVLYRKVLTFHSNDRVTLENGIEFNSAAMSPPTLEDDRWEGRRVKLYNGFHIEFRNPRTDELMYFEKVPLEKDVFFCCASICAPGAGDFSGVFGPASGPQTSPPLRSLNDVLDRPLMSARTGHGEVVGGGWMIYRCYRSYLSFRSNGLVTVTSKVLASDGLGEDAPHESEWQARFDFEAEEIRVLPPLTPELIALNQQLGHKFVELYRYRIIAGRLVQFSHSYDTQSATIHGTIRKPLVFA